MKGGSQVKSLLLLETGDPARRWQVHPPLNRERTRLSPGVGAGGRGGLRKARQGQGFDLGTSRPFHLCAPRRQGPAGARGVRPSGGTRSPAWRSAPPPNPESAVPTPPPTPGAGGPRVKRGGSPRRGAAAGPGMLSQDSDFLSKCWDFLQPAPAAAERERPSRPRLRGLLPSAHGRPPLPAPRSAPAPRRRRRRRARAARPAGRSRPPPALRPLGRRRPAEGCGAREPWNNAQRPARSR